MITYDRIMGVLAGQAVGDALGLPAEHKTAEWCEQKYVDGGPFDFERVERPSRDEVFEKGDWSDDTDQALILVDSWLEHRCVNPQDIAQRLLTWAKTQKGMGTHTRQVLEHPDFATDPYKAAEEVWKATGRVAAPNGAIMRSAVCGLFGATLVDTWRIAHDTARITHADPRCGLSAAIVAGVVFILVQGGSFNEAYDQVAKCRLAYTHLELPLERFERIDGTNQGFTFVTLCAALDTLYLFASIRGCRDDDRALAEACLRHLIRRGGDTDTNAAVAGALIGAMTGFETLGVGFPGSLACGLRRIEELEERAHALTKLHQEPVR